MANICTNILALSNLDKVLLEGFIKEMKACFDCYYVDEAETGVEIGFASKHCFPAKDLKEITGKINKLKVCIDVISYDFSVSYARYHQYINGQWKDVWSGETI